MSGPATGEPEHLAAFEALAADKLAPLAEDWERAGAVSREIVPLLAGAGLLGALVPTASGGTGWSHRDYGEANRVLGALSPSAQSLLTVHGMVTQALARWGSAPLRALLPRFAGGHAVAAFALSEADAGSDVRQLASTAEQVDGGWRLTGVKRWISFGQLADAFLVFARTAAGDAAFLVRRDDRGVTVSPEARTAGLRAARLAVLELDGCTVPGERLVGRPGFALTQIGGRALTYGRLWVAFGAVGLAESCHRATLERITTQSRFGQPLKDFQLVRGLVSDTELAVRSARLLARQAATASDTASQWLMDEVLAAKLAASRAATLAAGVCAQIHGAQGLVEDSPVQRRLADARVMEIIEGNTQLVQDLLADQTIARWRATSRGGVQ
ncbi:acyl-CoA dehydrogenase family protein [Streptantibioticus silvisoli]|uniref:Acyl-CoA dehydrogenase family protein n=1 Tax=Streptantibioticus silvisoli TaxID=2705255 RepID=A0ABT6VUD1_9ACTN|nr:acyl-CoA dehydrogenase family protein [Streptantibioticus silvisoli]MDI5961382.1 acyl-CoA dehydrogenase family protein [Streptantibioticus silvisoli]